MITFSKSALAMTVTIPTGKPIEVKTFQEIHPATTQVGDRILLVVDRDLIIDNKTVIKAGASVVAEVADSKEKSYAGQAGKILVSFKTVETVDGQTIAISGSQRREGDDKMIESIGLGLVCCPLFLLMKGEEGVITAGQVMTVYTVQSVEVNVLVK